MTLGIGYQGRDFATLVVDSMTLEGHEQTPQIGDGKFWQSGERIAFILSGRWSHDFPPPDVSQLSPQSAARALCDYLRPCNPEVDPSNGRGYECLVAGAPVGQAPSLAFHGRGSVPRVADVGDVMFIGCRAPRAREWGIEANYGDKTAPEAAELLLALGGMIISDLYAAFGYTGCRSIADFHAVTPGQVPAIAQPLHVLTVTPTGIARAGYQVEMHP